MMGAIVFDGAAPRMTPAGPDFITIVTPTADVEIIDTWDALGMRGSDSNDIAVNGLFVPESRVFRFVPDSLASAPFDGPLYRLPALAATDTIIAPVALAIAAGAIGELRDLLTSKIPLGSTKTARDRSAVQSCGRRSGGHGAIGAPLFYDTLTRAWERAVAQKPFTLEDKADLMLATTWAVRSAARATDLMHRMGGTNGIYTRSRLERHVRDAQTVRLHGFGSDSPSGNGRPGVPGSRAGISIRGVLTRAPLASLFRPRSPMSRSRAVRASSEEPIRTRRLRTPDVRAPAGDAAAPRADPQFPAFLSPCPLEGQVMPVDRPAGQAVVYNQQVM